MFKQIQARYQTSTRKRTLHQQQRFSYGLWLVAGCGIGFISWLLYRLFFQPAWLTILPPILLELINLIEAATAATLIFILVVLLWRTGQTTAPTDSDTIPVLNVDQLYALSPGAFEAYVGQLFRRKGYKVTLRGRTGDQGVDVELIKPDGQRAIVQCKRYRTTVGSETVRELFGTLIHERAAYAFLVTTAEISTAARSWAHNKPITLIDGQTLVQIALSLHRQQKTRQPMPQSRKSWFNL